MMKRKFLKLLIIFLDFFASKSTLVLGDSHAGVFENFLFKKTFPLRKFKVCSVGGATVSGLENPNSKTNTLGIFRSQLAFASKYDKIIFLLGEVDTGFVIWYRAIKYNVSVNEMLTKAIFNYVGLLKEAKLLGDVIVISAPLPTITDNNDWGEVANLRKEVKASQLERTELTIRFNHKIESYCLKNNILYFNFDQDSKGNNGLVKKELLNPNKSDHHYNSTAYANLILRKLKLYL